MPLITLKHPSHKGRAFAQTWLALAIAAGHNRSAHTDPQQQEAASPQLLCAGGLQRYAAD
jgi:hypothetical protein